ncbi:MAG: hypothetical protein JJD97_00180 [Gemmatimonadaceae bacterium]|nr:hypothetical protein [Gemmatimonadaceae bacterium]
MNGTLVFLLARIVHVLVGVTWAGAVIFIGWFLLPATRAVGPVGGSMMQQLVRVQRLPVYLMLLMAVTLLSGLSLYWLDIRAFGMAWVHTGPGRTFSVGATFAIITGLLGMLVNAPTAKKLGALGAAMQASGTQPSPEQAAEMGRLQNRLYRAAQIATVLVLLAVACMGVARYIP